MNLKHTYSSIGLILFFNLIVGSILQILLLVFTSLNISLASFLPLYVVSFPLSIYLLHSMPKEQVEIKQVSFGYLFKIFCMSLGAMLVGNIIGSFVDSLFGNTTSAVSTLITTQDVIFNIIFVVICAPIFEELVYRKYFIDLTAKYDAKLSVFVSALAFGLFHGNFSQFFFAFFLGLIFGRVYLQTRNIKYTIGLHMAINLLGSVIGPWTLTLSSFTPYYIYIGVYSLLGLVGLVLLIIKLRNGIQWQGDRIEKKERKNIFLNVGMILYGLACILLFVLSVL